MKTKKIRASISGEVNIKLPKSWQELNDAELRYIYGLRARGMDWPEVRRMFFLRKAGFLPVRRESDKVWRVQCGHVHCFVDITDMAVAADRLQWMEETPSVPVRIVEIQRCRAVNASLHGVSFGDWIHLENYHQGFILSHDVGAVRQMGPLLYPGVAPDQLTDTEILNISTWFTQTKMLFARKWPDLFSSTGGKSTPEQAMNAMIRALTGGDVLKETAVMNQVDVWRALEELNQKAAEAAQIKSAYSS